MKTTKTPSLTLPAAFLSLAGSVLIDARSGQAIATDGEAIVMHPLPEGFKSSRLVHVTENLPPITPDSGEGTGDTYDLASLENPPAYRIALNAAKLAHLAAAMENEVIVLELPAEPEGKAIKVLPFSGAKSAFLMPHPTPGGMPEGLLGNPQSEIPNRQSSIPPKADLPPPVVTASAERHTLEIAFGGVPAKEIRDALKDPALGFRYSGRGTKRGVPANVWYGPDNPFTREKIATLLPVPVQAAA